MCPTNGNRALGEDNQDEYRKETVMEEITNEEKNELDILQYIIPKGKENAILRPELCRRLGLDDRTTRKWIERARNNGLFVINDMDSQGYYIAETDAEIMRQYKADKGRALSLLKRLKHSRRYLKEKGYENL